MDSQLKDVRCACGKLLLRAEDNAIQGLVEIACRRCKRLAELRPQPPEDQSPNPERRR